MIPKECKRLAEVDFPIAVVSAHAAREKSIRHGHPSTLHLWWARRPLAACRSMLMALLLPDPAEALCPAAFKSKARELLPLAGCRDTEQTDVSLRRMLLKFIGEFANWDHAGEPMYLNVARGLVKAAHPDDTPLVVDPFAGGGSIPLEALRVGCEAFASDLNPVACLINKVLLEDIPRHGPELAQQLREAGEKVKAAAAAELAQFYPPDEDGATPIAYLWARTVRCESSGCGAEIPLVKSFWLSKKEGRYRALRPVGVEATQCSDFRATMLPVLASAAGPVGRPTVTFEVFSPTSEKEVRGSTVNNGKPTCLCCGKSLLPTRTRDQLTAQSGGADVIFDGSGRRIGGARLLAVVTLRSGVSGRHYRAATGADYAPLFAAQKLVAEFVAVGRPDGLSLIPDELINPQRPSPNARGLSAVTRYGVSRFASLFSKRQQLTLLRFQQAIPLDTSTSSLLALALSRVTERLTCFSRWDSSPKMESVAGTFARQALSMVWDYAEQNPFEAVGGNWDGALDWITQVINGLNGLQGGTTSQADASHSTLPDSSAAIWFTDPPYYDSVPYADVSDFFFVWLKRLLPQLAGTSVARDPVTGLTPKTDECVWNQAHLVDGKPKDAKFFEMKLATAFREGRRVLNNGNVACVVFAHKSTEGWEALLAGLIDSGWTITCSWPVTTEMANRTNARKTASLATSVHLVCRPRSPDAPAGDWDDVQQALPTRSPSG